MLLTAPAAKGSVPGVALRCEDSLSLLTTDCFGDLSDVLFFFLLNEDRNSVVLNPRQLM